MSASTENIVPTPWHVLDLMKEGENLLKFGRRGEPHFRNFVLSSDYTFVSWDSKKKKDSSQAKGNLVVVVLLVIIKSLVNSPSRYICLIINFINIKFIMYT